MSAEAMAARDAEEKRLRGQARRLRRAAAKLDLAATYWGDGAYQTARDRINTAGEEVRRTVGYMDRGRWMVPVKT